MVSISGSYGWQSLALVVAMWVRFLVFGRLNFAKEPVKGRNILVRKPTAYEHEIMMMMCWVNMYPIFDLFCIKGDQLGIVREVGQQEDIVQKLVHIQGQLSPEPCGGEPICLAFLIKTTWHE